MLANKGYDSDAIRADLNKRGVDPVIPTRSNRKIQVTVDKNKYAMRNLIEQFFNKLKHSRRVATRHDKLVSSFIGFVYLAIIRIWIRFVRKTQARKLLQKIRHQMACPRKDGDRLHRLIISNHNQSQPNMHLAPLIGEAFALREALLNGPHDSIEDISKALQRGKVYIHARIWLTFLSPAIVKNILNGNMPASINATKLLVATKDLAVKWAGQQRFIEALAR